MKLPGKEGYPKTLDIGDEVWQVKFKTRILNDDNVLGLCDPEKQTIYMKIKQTKRELFKTFLHEILHALEAVHSIKLKHKEVYKLEKAIARLILENY